MRVLITGSSGLIGSALVPALRSEGHEVIRLVRRPPEKPDELAWDPAGGTLSAQAVADSDAVIHLAGVGIGDRRWTKNYRRQIVDSRVDGTSTVAAAIAEASRSQYGANAAPDGGNQPGDPARPQPRASSPGPRVLLSASAIGWYGDTGDRIVDESAPRGSGFVAETVGRWEACTQPAVDAGVRTVLMRSGIVLSTSGGALARVIPIFRSGLGGPLGSGRQYVSFISQTDEIRAICFLLRADVSGPVNLTAPQAVTNLEYSRAIAHALHRPSIVRVPGFALRVALDGFADESILAGQRVAPTALTRAGFEFEHPDVRAALAAEL